MPRIVDYRGREYIFIQSKRPMLLTLGEYNSLTKRYNEYKREKSRKKGRKRR